MNMNKIQAKYITSYDQYIPAIFIDDQPLDQLISIAAGDDFYRNLWCAWLSDEDQERKYIWTLLEEKREVNVPVLLCPDDMDFSCVIIVAQVCFAQDTVTWGKIGCVTGKFDVKKWRESGIQNIDSWSDDDWQLYGGTLAWADSDDEIWQRWWSEHWPDEEMRRIWNYYHPYFNDDQNIKWLDCGPFVFSISDYNACITVFKNH